MPSSLSGSEQGPNPFTPVCIVQFARSQSPTALVGLFTSGAHCCSVVAAVPLSGPGTGRVLYYDGGNAGVRVETSGGAAILVSADDSFSYAFSSYAASGMPVKVLVVQNGKFADVTLRYRSLIDGDDVNWWHAYLQAQGDGLGVLAAWVADECMIGTSRHAFSVLEELASQGKLTSPDAFDGTGSSYIANLRTFLAAHGYSCT